jgi:hypothetical protein
MKILYVFCQLYRNHLSIKPLESLANKVQEKDELKMRGNQSNWNDIKKHGGIQGKVRKWKFYCPTVEGNTMTIMCFVVLKGK